MNRTVLRCGSTNDYPAGTEIRTHLVKGSELAIENGEGIYLEKCKGSKLQGTTGNTGSASEAVRWNIKAFTFEECRTEGFSGFEVLKLGSMSIQKIPGSFSGRLTAEGFEFSSAGGFCLNAVTAGSEVAILKSGSPPLIELHMTAPKTGGLFNCPELVIIAKYEVEAPLPLYVAAS